MEEKSVDIWKIAKFESEKQSWILDSTSRIPDSRHWVRDSLSVEHGFLIPESLVGFRIPEPGIPDSTSKNFLVGDSGTRGKNSTTKIVP